MTIGSLYRIVENIVEYFRITYKVGKLGSTLFYAYLFN